jgi:hypothetical protein
MFHINRGVGGGGDATEALVVQLAPRFLEQAPHVCRNQELRISLPVVRIRSMCRIWCRYPEFFRFFSDAIKIGFRFLIIKLRCFNVYIVIRK